MADANTPVQNTPGARSTLVTGLLVAAVAAFAFAGAGAATCAYHAFAPAAEAKNTEVIRGTSSVVAAVQELARIEAVAYHMERVIDIRDRQSHFFGLFQSEDALLLVAAVDVVAGVDLSRMSEHDIQVDPVTRSVRIVLPAASVLSAHLDNARTYVYSRTTDKLALPAPSLETRARSEAERTLRDAALEAGILERARTNAEQTVRRLLHALLFEHVDVTSQGE